MILGSYDKTMRNKILTFLILNLKLEDLCMKIYPKDLQVYLFTLFIVLISV